MCTAPRLLRNLEWLRKQLSIYCSRGRGNASPAQCGDRPIEKDGARLFSHFIIFKNISCKTCRFFTIKNIMKLIHIFWNKKSSLQARCTCPKRRSKMRRWKGRMWRCNTPSTDWSITSHRVTTSDSRDKVTITSGYALMARYNWTVFCCGRYLYFLI